MAPTLAFRGATATSYKLAWGELGRYIKVTAIGSGDFTGQVTSAPTVQITAPITNIGWIQGTALVGETLTAGVLTPGAATVTYQWEKSDSYDGTYSDILGANASTYIPVAEDLGKFLKVTATGYGFYTGTVTSWFLSIESTAPLRYIAPTTGIPSVNQTLTAGALSPTGSTANLQWGISSTIDGAYEAIPGANATTYVLTPDDDGKYIMVQAMGTGEYFGMVWSEPLWVGAEAIPFSQDFDALVYPDVPDKWTRDYLDLYNESDFWDMPYDLIYCDDSGESGGTPSELIFDYADEAFNGGYRISTPLIDATNATTTLGLSFKHVQYFYAGEAPEPFSIAVEVSTDGGATWTATSFAYDVTATIGPETANIDLGAYKGQKIMISWRTWGRTYWSNSWYIDDIVVSGS